MVCDSDRNCKGYVVMDGSYSDYCQIATTSECPNSNECMQNYVGNDGNLDEDKSCGQPSHYSGCFIKSRSKLIYSVHISF